MSIASDENTNAQPEVLGKALGLTAVDWSQVGLGETACTDFDSFVERITALLVVRIIAWIQPEGVFQDLSTTTICRSILTKLKLWPNTIDAAVVTSLREYVAAILSGYGTTDAIPYHNCLHCYHVTISSNKMMDMIVNTSDGNEYAYTYGFRHDPLMQLVVLFSALIHDVGHQGIPNRRLVLEEDELAVMYNDQSVAEMRSIYIAFSELQKPAYEGLRKVIFPSTQDYRRFRDATIDLVLSTDLASPDRSQVCKSKWKEAFGDPYETVERKVLRTMERRASVSSRNPRVAPRASRRMSAHSMLSELTLENTGFQSGSASGDLGDLGDDTSVSVTPDSSDNEAESGDNLGSPGRRPFPLRKSKSGDMDLRSPMEVRRVRKQSIDNSVDASIHSQSEALNGMALKFQRRLSTIGSGGATAAAKKRRTRLGLLRTVDLSGEAIDTYQEGIVRSSATGAKVDTLQMKRYAKEDTDQLRETVVMETLMRAADVAHNLQGWDQMATWSNRLFMELKRARSQGRGDDPESGWYGNQIGFLDAYVLPLARKLDDCGVFGDTRGAVFAQIVLDNKERWTRDGMSLTAQIIAEANQKFPEISS